MGRRDLKRFKYFQKRREKHASLQTIALRAIKENRAKAKEETLVK